MAQADPNVTMTVFWSPALQTRAAATIDDMLKMVPGFALNRRSSSRVSNPGAQALTLRGLGGSGSSRSIVLADGVPLNDPFAGWVTGTRYHKRRSIASRFSRGGGVICMGPMPLAASSKSSRSDRAADRGGCSSKAATWERGGLRPSWDRSAVAGRSAARVSGSRPTATSWSQKTNGVPSIPRLVRLTARPSACSGYHGTSGWRFDSRATIFAEDRKNGTPLQVNDTNASQISGEVGGEVAGGFLSTRVFRIGQTHDQTFSVISTEPPRASEELDRNRSSANRRRRRRDPMDQDVPPRRTLLVGGEGRFIDGSSNEIRFDDGRLIGTAESGGNQSLGSAFVRATFQPSDQLTLVAGVLRRRLALGIADHVECANGGIVQPSVSRSSIALGTRARRFGARPTGVSRTDAERALSRVSRRQHSNQSE